MEELKTVLKGKSYIRHTGDEWLDFDGKIEFSCNTRGSYSINGELNKEETRNLFYSMFYHYLSEKDEHLINEIKRIFC